MIWSKVQDPTGKWLALDARFLKYQQRSIGWVYDAALRTELTARLGVAFGPVVGGQADLVAVPTELREAFSQRSEQVEATLADYVRRWSDEHDSAEPDARTIARLERDAARDSRPAKVAARDCAALRNEWAERAADLGVDRRALTSEQLRVEGSSRFDREAVVTEALVRVTSESSTWLRADLAREVATLVPPGAARTATELVALVDELAEVAAGRCTELHPAPPAGVPLRADARPVSEHVAVYETEHARLQRELGTIDQL